ncbi:NAD(P)/FAD-dependent oxidoreductase [Sphingobium sp. B2]|uniref:NAD(P)/FAD-dependent oxidoreductase n=1 Tax=Sphingobium sp. B2 TaxID=2583228 RepID=UPI0011AAE908|nr:FAD-binding oxidoreductase [Sphingobium sp. B2]
MEHAPIRKPYAGLPSYYAATANRVTERPQLRGEERCDVAVVGAGFTGMSAALELAERGYSVIVVEGERVGWGASGRNGGQLVNGYSRQLSEVRKHYGAEAERQFGEIAREGSDIIRERVAKYGIECDLRDGNSIVGMHDAHMRFLRGRVEEWHRHGYTDVELLEGDAIRKVVNSDRYVGGYYDPRGGHMHSLNYVLGEAAAFEALGGRIFEQSRVTKVDRSARPVVHTAQGHIVANKVLVCGNAYLGDAAPDLSGRILPVSSQIIGTEVLGKELLDELFPANAAVEDTRYIPDYYRRTADHRIIYGGGSVYGGIDPANITAKIMPQLLQTFPQLRNVKIDFVWAGNFALTMTRYPQVGRVSDSVYYSQGDSGHGVTTTQMLGRRLAEAIDGQLTKFDVFARLPYIPFVGGKLLRVPYCVIGSWYYGLRDKLGI